MLSSVGRRDVLEVAVVVGYRPAMLLLVGLTLFLKVLENELRLELLLLLQRQDDSVALFEAVLVVFVHARAVACALVGLDCRPRRTSCGQVHLESVFVAFGQLLVGRIEVICGLQMRAVSEMLA